jgi:hypothetical protein
VFLAQFYRHYRPNQVKIPRNEGESRQLGKANGVEEHRHALWPSGKNDPIRSGQIQITAPKTVIPKPKALPSPADPVLRRAEELDALDAILPFDRCDQLAVLLTDDDVAALKHLAKEGMGDNTLKALASDLGDLEA